MKHFPASVEFVWPWRNYQGRVLSELDLHLDDNHLHIIAAAGSGKTVLGLEVVRRLDAPAVIFAPTIKALLWQGLSWGLFVFGYMSYLACVSGSKQRTRPILRRYVEKIRRCGAAVIHKNHGWQTNPAQGESKSNVNGLDETLRKNQSLEVTRCKIKE